MEDHFIPFQIELQQKLPVVIGNKDYTVFLERLERIDEIIRLGNLEQIVIGHVLKEVEEKRRRTAQENGKRYQELKSKARKRIQRNSIRALRCGIARHLTGEERYR